MALTGFVDDRVPRDARVPRSPARRLLVGLSALVTILLGLAPAVATAQLNASIAANRTSGLAPLAVRFDATGSDCNGNGTAGEWNADLEQCLYSWDFGDPLAPPYEYGSRALSGQAQSANLSQGFIAGHVFENPGTYVVTLTIRNSSGQTATRTQTITANIYSGTTACIRANTGGSFSGCPSGAAQITQSSFASALSECGATSGARRCLFRRGDTFNAGGGVDLANGPGIIGAFGSGARPVVSGSSSGPDGLIRNGNDWRIMDLDVVGAGITGRPHRLLYRTRIRDITTSGVAGLLWWGNGLANLYVVRSEIENCTGYYGMYTTAENVVVLGSSISGNGSTNAHNFRMGDVNRSVLASNKLGPVVGGGGVLKFTGENGGSSNWVFRDNHGQMNVWGGWGFAPQYSGAIADGTDQPIQRGLIEANFSAPSGSGSGSDNNMMNFASIQDVVIRNNICDLTGRYGQCVWVRANGGGDPGTSNLAIMNNTASWRTGSNGSGSPAFDVASALSGVRLANNLLYHGVSYSGAVASCGGSSCTLNSANLKTSTSPFTGSGLTDPWQYRLRSGTQPVGAAISRAEVLTDFSGAPRNGARDIGAWQLGGENSPPPPPVLLP